MTTAKRSSDLFSTLFWMAPLWESSSRMEPKQSPSSETVTLWQLHRFHSVTAVSLLFHNCDMFIIWKLSLPTLLVIMPSSVFDKKPAWAASCCWSCKTRFQCEQTWTILWSSSMKDLHGPFRSSSMKDLHCDLQVWCLLVRQLGPGTLCCRAHTWTNVSSNNKIQGNSKGLEITACMCSQGESWTTRYEKDGKPNTQRHFWRLGAKAGCCTCPMHKGMG